MDIFHGHTMSFTPNIIYIASCKGLRLDKVICCVNCYDLLYVHWHLRYVYLQIFERM